MVKIFVNRSTYAFWRHSNFSIEKTPIAFLGFNWAGNTILTNTLYEFFQLLSLGVDHLGYAVHFSPEWIDYISTSDETLYFRAWLQSELNVLQPKDPIKIIEEAKNNHPDFGKWIESKTGIPLEQLPRPP